MKCGYCSGEVAKEEAIKDKRYFHKECYKIKQGKIEIEKYWLDNINKGTVLQILRKVIKDIVEIYDIEYIMWVLKKSKIDGINLQYPQGLKKLLDGNYKKQWETELINNKLKDMNKDFLIYIKLENNSFVYKPKTKNFTDII